MEEEEARSANRVADPYLDAGVAMTETEIAEELGISKQRVCQLLQHALAKLKVAFEARGYTDSKWR